MKMVLAVVALLVAASFFLPFPAFAAHSIVGDGETVSWPHTYTYYRFVVMGRSSNNGFRIAELALYDNDGNRVNQGLVEAAADAKATTNLLAGTYALYRNEGGSVYESFDRMFDGDVSTSCNAWINTADSEWYWWYFVMRPRDGANPIVAYNVCLPTSEASKSPRSWALQASDDHAAWITLNEYNAAATGDSALDSGGWCNGGEDISVMDESAHLFVERGGTLEITKNATPISVHSYGGAVAIAPSATLCRDVVSGESKRYVGGRISGVGTFEKTGEGALAVSGVNSVFAGAVKASGGTLAFRPLHVTPKFRYYRFIVKNRAAENLSIAELALYDADGERINLGIVQASEPEWSSTNLLPGTYSKFGQGSTTTSTTSAKNLFDGNLSTDVNGWISNSNDPYYWIYFNMRLPEDSDVAPASYNLAFTSQLDRAPKSWALQGSDDHTTWFSLDERDAAAVAAIAPSSAGWCNGGTPLPLTWEGYNAPVGEVDAKYFRFTVKAVGGSDGTRRISEISLYDMQGKRLNVGLTSAGRNISVNTLAAGSFTWKYQWNGTYNGDDQHEDKMFDENMDTRLQGWSFGYAPDPATPATWMVWTMRLADDAAPVASYNFAPHGTPGGASCPVNWLVEASRDGTTWFEVDARSGDAATAVLPAAAKNYCNSGHPIGFTMNCDRWLAPTGAVVEVVNGATLELPATEVNAVAGLAVDLTAAAPLGTIANFNPATSGTLYLTSTTSRPQLMNYAVPIVFTDVSNTSRISNWAVRVNGVTAPEDEYSLGFDKNGVLRITRHGPGVMLIIY